MHYNHIFICAFQHQVNFTNSNTTMLTSFQPLFITTPHRSFLALFTHSQLFLLFIIYLLLDLYSAFSSKSLRHCIENLKTWPIEHYTSKIKLKLGKVDKQTGMENRMDNELSGKKGKSILVCSFFHLLYDTLRTYPW